MSPCVFRFMGSEASKSRGAILMHVVNHATYHRGWIAEMFFQVPAGNATTDFPVFLRELALRTTCPSSGCALGRISARARAACSGGGRR
jgi:hypothetical protein